MIYLSLFSGIEAATVAWEPLGWEPLAFAEIEPFPNAVLKYHYPDVPNMGDVTEANFEGLREEDTDGGGDTCKPVGTRQ